MKDKIFISYSEKISNPQVSRITFAKILNEIKNGKYKRIIEKIRNENDEKLRMLYKRKYLPYFTFAKFKNSYRSNDNFIHTEFLILDIDKISKRKISILKKYYKSGKRIFCCFVSPGGKGIKVIYKLNRKIKDANEYKLVYKRLMTDILNYFGIKADDTIDPSRACYISFDPKIIYNPNCKTINVDEIISKEKTIVKFNDNDIDLSLLSDIIDFLAGKLNYNEWISCGFALASLGAEGRKYFVELTTKDTRYKDNEEFGNNKFDELLSRFNENKTHIKSLFLLAYNKGYEFKKYKIKEFWNYDNGRLDIKIDNYLKFLEERGVAKMKIEGKYYFIRKENNIIKLVNIIDIRDLILNYLDKTNNKNIRERMLRRSNYYFNEKLLESIKTVDYIFHKETIDKSYIYFNNCYVEINKNGVVEKEYTELKNEVIWDKYIINRDFINTNKISDFSKFIENICKGNKYRVKSLRSSIGYLLHTYKNPTFTKAIIFCDESIKEEANGRSGKSLVGQAILKIRNVAIEDGRRFDGNNRFAYQKVNIDSQVIIYDDISYKFPFDKLFHSITDGLEVEKKNKDAFTIPFVSSPKYLITTNYVIQGEGISLLDRMYEIEFSDYYNLNHRPVNDFDKRFFDDWNNDEWNAFFKYMMNCIRLYLNRGIIFIKQKNTTIKKIISYTDSDFYNFIIKINKKKEYNLKKLYLNFIRNYKDSDFNIKQNRFTKWLKFYANKSDYELSIRASSNNRFVRFKKEVKK